MMTKNVLNVEETPVFQLTISSKLVYFIKVQPSKSEKGVLRLFYKKKEQKQYWENFATCTISDNIRQVINVYFGFRGELKLIKAKN